MSLTTEPAKCSLCGEPMPPGEEMFKFHGYSGSCPRPMLPIEPKAEVSHWQQIETASKDGTRVLLFGPDGITTGYYDPGVKGHEEAFPAGWRGHFEPTHWMPLPEPPANEA